MIIPEKGTQLRLVHDFAGKGWAKGSIVTVIKPAVFVETADGSPGILYEGEFELVKNNSDQTS